MAEVLRIGTQVINDKELVPLLANYLMLPNFLREIIIDRALVDIDYTNTERETAIQAFLQKNQLTNEAQLQAWLNFHYLHQNQLESIATRQLRIEKFKQITWGVKVESYFLNRKIQLDKAIYSLIRLNDPEIAQEIYFRLVEGEQSFGELAKQYSQGPEAQTGGMVGPVEFGSIHPNLAQLLSKSQPGQVLPPMRLAEWIVIVRLEKLIVATLDDLMRQRLLNELFNNWLQEQVQQVGSIQPDLNEVAI